MANQILYSATIVPANAAMEVSTNGGTSFTALAFTTVGSVQQGTLTGVAAGSFAAGQLVMRAVGYGSTTTLSNTAAVTVTAASTGPTIANFTARGDQTAATPAAPVAVVGKTFIYFEGDSNTATGGEGGFTAPGKGYVSLVTAQLGANYAYVNSGTGGGTTVSRAVDLTNRFSTAWTAAGRTAYPNAMLCWMTGTNDPANGVTLAQAQTTITGLRAQMDAVAAGIRVVLMSAIEPSFHQNGPTGQVYFQQLADWESVNYTALGYQGFYNLRANPRINRLVTYAQAASFNLAPDEAYFSEQTYGGIGGTGNGGVPFDSFHMGVLGHMELTEHLSPLIRNVIEAVPQPARSNPPLPTFTAFDDVANTVTLVPATGFTASQYNYYLPGSGTSSAPVPANGVIQVGNLAGVVTVFSPPTPAYYQSGVVTSPAFTVTITISGLTATAS